MKQITESEFMDRLGGCHLVIVERMLHCIRTTYIDDNWNYYSLNIRYNSSKKPTNKIKIRCFKLTENDVYSIIAPRLI